MGRTKKTPDTERYSGRVSQRLRALRESRFPDIENFANEISRAGLAVPVSSLYKYESGESRLPHDYIPFFANALGITCRALLPKC